MTVKEMINKVNTYNEVAEIIGRNKLELSFSMKFFSGTKVDNLKEFKKFLKDELIEEFGKAIMECDAYEFGKDTEITFEDMFFGEFREVVTFSLNEAW